MYIDAFYDRRKDVIRVSERVNGKRILRDLNPVYEMYTESKNGTVQSITGEKCIKHTFNSSKDMRDFIQMCKTSNVKMFESDVNVLLKTLYKTYKDEKSPNLNTVFFDIEVDFHKTKGYADVSDPFNRITAFSLFFKNTKEHYCLVLPPDDMDWNIAQHIVNSFDPLLYTVELFDTEENMIRRFMDLIDDADVLSGWNSEVFDIPYIVNRVSRVMGDHELAHLCLWNQPPKAKTIESFGREIGTYELVGRVHLDYMDLYKKHSQGEEPSYSLDAIASKVTGDHKVAYIGNLDKLYHEEFRRFIDYSLQDTNLLFLIDKKKNHIDTHNQMAHEDCIPILMTLGTVGLVDAAIINEIHRSGDIVFDKREHAQDPFGAAGAWVQDPVIGLHEEIGCSDFNSLYPSTIRSLNMSPETIVGQIRQTYTNAFLAEQIEKQKQQSKTKNFEPNYTEAWHSLYSSIEFQMVHDKTDDILDVDLEDGTSFSCTAHELYDTIFAPDSTLVMSANGTLFDKSKQGIIPRVLSKWYAERKLYKRASGDCKQLSGKAALENEQGFTDEEMNKKYAGVTRFDWFAEHEPNMKLVKRGEKWFAEDSEMAYAQFAYYDLIQYIKKITLNMTYGALLNPHCRFYDKRLGQSTTLTGRRMAKHLASKLNEVITGEYNHVGGAVVYGDSLIPKTSIDTNLGKISIEELYNNSTILKDWNSDFNSTPCYNNQELKIKTFDKTTNETYYEYPERILKHENSSRYEIKDENGNSVIGTEDHGYVAEVNGVIINCTPIELSKYIEEGKEVYLIGN